MSTKNTIKSTSTLADKNIRARALDITQSFIVQAPAGSGKTELLTQRILKLLAYCHEPEEILAITFTRKAASEMRSRILQALLNAKIFKTQYSGIEEQAFANLSDHQQLGLKLALAVLEQDTKMHWQLLENPQRLQLKTIDSFCSSIAFHLPITSQLGGQLGISEDAYPIYQDASKAFLQSLETGHPWSAGLARIILYMDKANQTLEDLFANMLARRLQWLPLVAKAHFQNPANLQVHIEAALEDIAHTAIDKIKHNSAYPSLEKTTEVFAFCSQYAPEHSNLKNLGTISELKEIDNLTQWEALAELLLTESGSWRKALNKNQGFPPESSTSNPEEKLLFKTQKNNLQRLLAELNPDNSLRLALDAVRSLPPGKINQEQLEITADLCECLITLLGFLQLSFQKFKSIDFSEVQLKASQSLNPDMDLQDNEFSKPALLALDNKIQHILIDEYQDTSNSQLELLEHLISQWQFQEQRKSLFLVGDPMQSIYRFREANVGIFIEAQQRGIKNITLEALHLSTNFRSTNGIVNWVNLIFSKSFPFENDYNSGAITYSPSLAFHQNNEAAQKNVHCFIRKIEKQEAADKIHEDEESNNEQAKHLCKQIQAIKNKDKANKESIAILIRSRSHAIDIIKQLKLAGVVYQAVEIDALASTSHIISLLNLSAALLHPGDHLAWFSLLRSSLVGLETSDLLIFGKALEQKPVTVLLADKSIHETLSQAAQNILKRCAPVLLAALKDTRTKPFAITLESCWLSLGGASMIAPENIQDCISFFDLLRKLQASNEFIDSHTLESACQNLYANQTSGDSNPVKIMTIHKSKGLEFDHVFIPCLNKTPRSKDKNLLNWDIYHSDTRTDYLLLAPLAGEHITKRIQQKNKTSLYDFLANQEKLKIKNESVRLLYVAATRAKQYLYLYADLAINQNPDENNKYPEIKNPPANSLLALIWEQLEDICFIESEINKQADKQTPKTLLPYQLKRISSQWINPLHSIQTPKNKKALPENALTSSADKEKFFEQAALANAIGSVTHRCLKQFAMHSDKEKQSYWLNPNNYKSYHPLWYRQLRELGIFNKEDLLAAVQQVELILTACFKDHDNLWIFDNTLEDSYCELALAYKHVDTNCKDDNFKYVVIDRTFIKDGTRWIIDYKTSAPDEHQDMNTFLQQQAKLHLEQLQNYGLCFRGLEDKKQQSALYFPKIAKLFLYSA